MNRGKQLMEIPKKGVTSRIKAAVAAEDEVMIIDENVTVVDAGVVAAADVDRRPTLTTRKTATTKLNRSQR